MGSKAESAELSMAFVRYLPIVLASTAATFLSFMVLALVFLLSWEGGIQLLVQIREEKLVVGEELTLIFGVQCVRVYVQVLEVSH